jgi:tetratricopeptide (TPR) repeat protein
MSASSRTKGPTIGSLGKRPVIVEDMPLDTSETETIEAYRKFLASKEETETRPLAMRRLADLELEADDMPAVGMDSPGLNQVRPQQVNDSIRLYREVLTQYPERPDNDAVLYQLARAYEHNAQPLESLKILGRLTQRFPNSSYVLEAQFRRGEILFVKKRYREAGQAYQQVVSANDTSAFYRQSLYKLGWCYFKQSLYTEGLDSFMALLDLSLDGSETGETQLEQLSRTERELIEDTLRVITLSFSYGTGSEEIYGYFSDQETRHYADLVYERLGRLYLVKERYTDAASTFQNFANNYP